jgi:hypothetical protein
MPQLPLDTSVQAEYTDGYIHDETTLNDLSPYTNQHNILNDIIQKRPEAEHGPMVRFSCYYRNNRYDVAWNTIPANARPIRFRHGYLATDSDGNQESGWNGMQFGYQYNDTDGKNIQEVQNL